MDLYLRFPDRQTADDVLQDYEGSIDIIGEIEGAQGWHVNVRGGEAPNLVKYEIRPETPMRVWA